MNKYDYADILICKKEISGGELEMTNPDVKIPVGSAFVVTDFKEYSKECAWIEILGLTKNLKGVYFAGYNDEGHEIFDTTFKKVRLTSTSLVQDKKILKLK